jgi:hypothetical protein
MRVAIISGAVAASVVITLNAAPSFIDSLAGNRENPDNADPCRRRVHDQQGQTRNAW